MGVRLCFYQSSPCPLFKNKVPGDPWQEHKNQQMRFDIKSWHKQNDKADKGILIGGFIVAIAWVLSL
jgi:hypothetical protein